MLFGFLGADGAQVEGGDFDDEHAEREASIQGA